MLTESEEYDAQKPRGEAVAGAVADAPILAARQNSWYACLEVRSVGKPTQFTVGQVGNASDDSWSAPHIASCISMRWWPDR